MALDLSHLDDETRNALQKQLQSYNKALEEEFATALKEHPENAEREIKEFFLNYAAHFAAQIYHLSQHASNEGVRLSAAKYGLSIAREESIGQGDPIRELMNQLTGNDSDNKPEWVGKFEKEALAVPVARQHEDDGA